MKTILKFLGFWTAILATRALFAHLGYHGADGFFVAGGLPLAAGGAITQQMLQGLATWDSGAWSTQAVVGSFTATVAQILSGSNTYLTLTGSAGAVNLTTPTALQLLNQYLAAYGQPPANGSTFTLEISNQTNGTVTVVGGTGVTVNGTAGVATTVNRTFLGTFTNTNPGAAAVTLQNLGSRSN